MNKNLFNIYKECVTDEVNTAQEWEKLASVIGPKRNTSTHQKINLFISLIKYAAVLFIGIGGTWLGMHFFSSQETSSLGMNKVATGKGEKSFIELQDGTKIWLNSCTTLSYTSDYGKKNRKICLDGEAYFEVAKDAKRPFIVKTNDVSVTALGTSFNVSAYSEDNRLTTTLFSGKVSVQPNITQQQILLNPNQVAIYYKNGNRIEKMPYDKRLFMQWRNGAVSFYMMRMSDITKQLERNYDVAFRYETKSIQDLQFTGSFRNNETLSEILKVIQTNTNMNYIVRNDTVIMK